MSTQSNYKRTIAIQLTLFENQEVEEKATTENCFSKILHFSDFYSSRLRSNEDNEREKILNKLAESAKRLCW